MRKSYLQTTVLSAALLLGGVGCDHQHSTGAAIEPVPLEDVRTSYSDDMQQSLSAYFTMHALPADKPLPAGATIPWVSSRKSDETHGFLVATGEVTERGTPVYNAVTLENNGKYGTRYNKTLALKP